MFKKEVIPSLLIVRVFEVRGFFGVVFFGLLKYFLVNIDYLWQSHSCFTLDFL